MRPNQPTIGEQRSSEQDVEFHDQRAFATRKRLLSGCLSNKKGSETTVVESQPLKKTRDLPNLSECHGCGFRIDALDGRSRVQTLYSEWRIVLLCRKCYSGVESSVLCSYCFKIALSGETFRCSQCKRCVHKMCFSECRNVPPWSYSCPGVEFSLCVDCWVPKPMASRRRALGSKKRKNCSVLDRENLKVLEPGNCRVQGSGSCKVTNTKCMDAEVKDANCVVGKEIEAAVTLTVVMKQVAIKQAVELVSDALEWAGNKDQIASNESSGDCSVLDDSEFAFRLHRAMNSSPRISKNMCLQKSRSLEGERMPNCQGDLLPRFPPSSKSNVSQNPEVCPNKKLQDDLHRRSWWHPVGVIIADQVMPTNIDHPKFGRVYVRTKRKHAKCELGSRFINPTNVVDDKLHGRVYVRNRTKDRKSEQGIRVINPKHVDFLKPEGKVYVRTRFKDGKCKHKSSGDVEDVELRFKEGEGSCSTKMINSSWDDNSMNSASRSCCDIDLPSLPNVGRTKDHPDRYLVKYKRKICSKLMEQGRYKFPNEGILCQFQSSTSGLHLNGSKESGTYSDGSLQSCGSPVK